MAPALVWVHNALGGLRPYELARDGLPDAVAALLRRVWIETPREVRMPGEAREAFLSLLAQMAGLGSASAIELQSQVARGSRN